MVVAPLYYQDDLIGLLELGSPHRGDLHALNTMKLREVIPLFAMAVKRSMDELNTRVQAIIKEQCTAIHPALEWRFRQAALQLIQARQICATTEMEPIVFDGVYPLYGVSDIRASSRHRSAAIQTDLFEHLSLAKTILDIAYGCKPLPILDALTYRIRNLMSGLETGLDSGEEVTITEFLRQNIEPLFDHMQGFCPEAEEKIRDYQAALEPRLGTVYKQRKAFEESVTQINEALSAYIDTEQEKAQAMFPHYFEKRKTDGVEYSIYIGASMAPDGKFDQLYLHNLRLWQLIVMCGMVRESERLKPLLQVPLEMAHLILVQHTPLSVRFRQDEKRFDIDGAYNMRYEIVKKRIDKATIMGTHQRLTQPGMIAIVYSQPEEAQEYREYIAYLQNAGYLKGDTEAYNLNDLEGAQGLKALRVAVNPDETSNGQNLNSDDLEAIIDAMPQRVTEP
ncbi:MAG: hypothetical protein O7G88_08080 [bacterium]|nr:hypothetical protein [bacterium]